MSCNVLQNLKKSEFILRKIDYSWNSELIATVIFVKIGFKNLISLTTSWVIFFSRFNKK